MFRTATTTIEAAMTTSTGCVGSTTHSSAAAIKVTLWPSVNAVTRMATSRSALRSEVFRETYPAAKTSESKKRT